MHPAIVKYCLVPLHERAMGRPTMTLLRSLLRTQHHSFEQLRNLQTQKLRRLLAHAWTNCPAYRARIDAAGIDPATADLKSLANLPTLSKDDLRRDLHAFCDPNVPGGLHRCTTGGSSGDPLVFRVDRTRQAADQAARARARRWFGIDIGEREFYLWGAAVERSRQDRIKSLRDRLTNQRLVSAFQMTPRRMDEYLVALQRFDPVHIFGYPTSIARLVEHGRRRGRKVRTRSLRAVFTTGEVLLPPDRTAIAAYFGVPVADGYGSREAGFIAHECPRGAMHVTMESLVVELLDPEGRPARAGESGEITVTHLEAYGMPFIRYRTGDLARWGDRPCDCGRKLQTLAGIEGRRGDAIRTPDGGFAHPLSVIYPLRESPHVRQFQVVQRGDLSLDVQVVPADAWSDDDLAALSAHVSRQFSGRLCVRVRTVEAIPPDAAGKHRPVRSEATTALVEEALAGARGSEMR